MARPGTCHLICEIAETNLNTKRHSTVIDPRRNAKTGRSCTVRRFALVVAMLSLLTLGSIGCGSRAVSASDVSPVQRPSRHRPKAVQPVEEPQTQAIPALESRQHAASPAAKPTPDSVIAFQPPTEPSPSVRQVPQIAQEEPGIRPTVAQAGETPEEHAPSHEITVADVSEPPVSSPATQTPSPAAQTPAPAVQAPVSAGTQEAPSEPEETVQINFEDVDIHTVLKTIGEITGINFIPAQSVTGTVRVMSPTPIPLSDIYPFLLSILDVHGYAAIETENAVKIVPKTEATKRNLQVRIGANPAMIPMNDTMVTQILPVKFADATEVSQIVQPLLSTGALMATYPRTNSIMITDTSANIHHIAQVIQQLDIEGSRENVLMFPLAYASAEVLSEQILRILDENRTATTPPGRVRSAQIEGQTTKVLPDERTNSLIVVGSEQDIDTIRRLVAQLDVERPTGADNVHVTYLKNADANDVAPSLEAALAGMRLTDATDPRQQIQVTADPSTNSLIIVASPQDFAMISGIVEKLDIVREQVLVEMTILEIGEDALRQLGVDWATLDEAVTSSVRGFGLTNFGPRVDFLNNNIEGLAVGAWKDTGAGVQVGAILQALEKQSAVNILSTPSLLTSNHRKARIVVGENTPYVIQSRITEGFDSLNSTNIKSYEYKDVGITLEITPHVSQGGSVRLQIDSEFTKLIDSVTTSSPDTPTTAKRSAQTAVTMQSGNTVVIGGLIRDDKTRIENKIPVVGDVPLVGNLFRWQQDRVQKTNLLIFITPHVMTSQEELQQVTNQKRQQMLPLLEQGR